MNRTPPSPAAWDEEPASPEEIRAALQPSTEEERRTILDLVRWFTRRYPGYLDRSDYIRRKWREAEMLRRAGVSPR